MRRSHSSSYSFTPSLTYQARLAARLPGTTTARSPNEPESQILSRHGTPQCLVLSLPPYRISERAVAITMFSYTHSCRTFSFIHRVAMHRQSVTSTRPTWTIRETRTQRLRALVFISLIFFGEWGCKRERASTRAPQTPKTDPLADIRRKPTCLVLSVGGPAGIASHLGAIQAIQEHQIKFDCISGNSAGSLIGAILAYQPKKKVAYGFTKFRDIYVNLTKKKAKGRGVFWGLLAGAAVVATGGAAAPALVGATAGGLIGAGRTKRVDHGRLVAALDIYFEGRNIEQFPISFTTWHQKLENQSLDLKALSAGSVAKAVGDSVKHPLLFPDLKIDEMETIDPGMDRVSATPLLDACDAYPDHKLLVLNASGRETFVKGVDCPYEIIEFSPSNIEPKSLFQMDASFHAVASKSRSQANDFLNHSRYFQGS